MIVLAMIVAGCGHEKTEVAPDEPGEKPAIGKKNWEVYVQGIPGAYKVRLIVIDECEYLLNTVHNGLSLTHKGNCKFCRERNK